MWGLLIFCDFEPLSAFTMCCGVLFRTPDFFVQIHSNPLSVKNEAILGGAEIRITANSPIAFNKAIYT